MSATTDGRRGPLFSINPALAFSGIDDSGFTGDAGVYDKLEAFVSATRKLEQALTLERARTRKLQDDFRQTQSTYDRLLGEAEARAREHQIGESKVRATLGEVEKREHAISDREKNAQVEFRKVAAELTRYRSAWAQVLDREREAKMILRESTELGKRREELETRAKSAEVTLEEEKRQRIQLDQHAKSYQAELQNVLVRLHSAECKFSELTKEYQTLAQSRRKVDDEVARIEASMRERADWEFAKEREKLRAELGRESALEREAFREESRRALQMDLQQALSVERHRTERDRDALLVEIACHKEALYQSRKETETLRDGAAQDRAKGDAALATARKFETEAARLKNQLNGARAETSIIRQVAERQKQALIDSEAEIRFTRVETERMLSEIATFETQTSALRGDYETIRVRFDEQQTGFEQDREKAVREREAISKQIATLTRTSEIKSSGLEARITLELSARARVVASVRETVAALAAQDTTGLFAAHLRQQSRAIDAVIDESEDREYRQELLERQQRLSETVTELDAHAAELSQRWAVLDRWLQNESPEIHSAVASSPQDPLS